MRLVVPAVLLLFSSPLFPNSESTARFVLFDGARRVQLQPIEHELSVRSDLSPPAIEQALASLGFEEFRAAESLGPDHTLFVRPNASDTLRSDGPLESPVDALGQSPIVDVVRGLARAIGGFISPVFRATPDEPRTVLAPEVALRFRSGVSPSVAELTLRRYGDITRRDRVRMPGVYSVTLPTYSALDAVDVTNELAAREDVEWVWAGRHFYADFPSGRYLPNDPFFARSWNLDHQIDQQPGAGGVQEDLDVNGPEVWFDPPGQSGNADVILLIMDNGVQRYQAGLDDCALQNPQDNPDITFEYGTDETTHSLQCGGRPTNICDNHGTWVAGVVGAFMDNSTGTTGLAPGVQFASARVFGRASAPGVPPASCSGFDFDVAYTLDALAWAQDLAAQQGKRIVTNYSANAYPPEQVPSPSLDAAYSETWREGMVHFISAGNKALTSVEYPGRISWVNSITNLTWEGTSPQLQYTPNSNPAFGSSYGADADFTAPGTTVFTTDRTGAAGGCNGTTWRSSCDLGEANYFYATGTSFASPLAAAVAALVLSENPNLSSQAVEWVMRMSARDLGPTGWDIQFGWGIPRADAAVLLARNLKFLDGFETGGTECWGPAMDNGLRPCAGGYDFP